jgi:hypothetical protein
VGRYISNGCEFEALGELIPQFSPGHNITGSVAVSAKLSTSCRSTGQAVSRTSVSGFNASTIVPTFAIHYWLALACVHLNHSPWGRQDPNGVLAA